MRIADGELRIAELRIAEFRISNFVAFEVVCHCLVPVTMMTALSFETAKQFPFRNPHFPIRISQSAIRNSQSAFPNSHFAIRNPHFPIRNPHFPIRISQRFRRSESSPASIVSMEVEKEKRKWPSPCSPNTIPGTVATWARSSNNSAASRLSLLIRVASGNA